MVHIDYPDTCTIMIRMLAHLQEIVWQALVKFSEALFQSVVDGTLVKHAVDTTKGSPFTLGYNR